MLAGAPSGTAVGALQVAAAVVLLYALASALLQAVVVTAGVVRIPRRLLRDTRSGIDDVFAHPGTPGVTVVVPARNESAGIVDTVRSLLSLRYPSLQIVVVDDGSDDDTAARLVDQFGLVPASRRPTYDLPVVGAVLDVLEQPGGPLLLVSKRGAGRKADALNAGINYATEPLVCMVDADGVLEPEALLHAAQPLVEDPDVHAVGGIVRPANGLTIRSGQVVRVTAPRTLLARIQAVEYLRAFLLARVAWTGVNGVLVVAGAFAVFRTRTVVELGGLAVDTIAEDAELVARLHHRMRRDGRSCRVVIVPQPVCWSEVPENHRDLARQRRRWAAGLTEVLIAYRSAFLNPRQGRFGWLVLPYFLVFELLAPFVEVLGWILVPAGFLLGVLDVGFTLAWVAVSVGFGILLSLAAVAAEEIIFHQYARWRDVLALCLAAVAENAGIRQVICFHRLVGTVQAMLGRQVSWSGHRRLGLGGGPTAGRHQEVNP